LRFTSSLKEFRRKISSGKILVSKDIDKGHKALGTF
jgi:hypothetical protein